MTLGRLHWGADIAIACDYPGAYEVNIPVTGRLESRGSHGETVSVPGQATVFRADTPSVITHWGATCSVLGVKFDREHLEREADRILGSPVRTPKRSGISSPRKPALPASIQMSRGIS
ncbi:hypothetical protein AIIKEEIJ_02896 [Rhodococcus sp. YH1]|nr:hypothetical protein [Rhodococcus sp. YH1]